MSPSRDCSGSPREPHLLRFRLRQLFFVVTLACGLCALVAATDGPWPWVISLVSLLVAGHILGNLIGTRLRDTSEEVVRWSASDSHVSSGTLPTAPPGSRESWALPPETNLAHFGRVAAGLRWYLLGGLAGGWILGGTLLAAAVGHRIGWIGWLVGSFSGGVFGIWIAFMGVSFTTIARDALRQANER